MSNAETAPNGKPDSETKANNFVRTIIEEDLARNKYQGRVVTRFPPEPNGYLHIGHAKSICLNFGLAQEFNGQCHLRFDDTNPTKEDIEYVHSIQQDIKWLGFDWQPNLFHASQYFEQFYEKAVFLIKKGKAYVCSLNEEEIREYRGTVTEPGKPSPYRARSVEQNLDLFQRMRNGEFEDGTHVLRANIDMAAANMKMRDPLLYRIRHAHHYKTGDAWCIYPMYDFAHPLSDAFENITHSICTLEFENNRELYDWVVAECETEAVPRQYEFARLNLTNMIMSKRKLLRLVNEGLVEGWDDPRMPTIAGFRRRGYTPESIRNFCDMIGVAKANSTVDLGQLEFSVRDDLNFKVPRVLAVAKPLKVVIENYEEGKEENIEGSLYPHDVPLEGSRTIPFSREIYIDRDDFMLEPPKKFFRLAPGREVRLRHAYIIKCEHVVQDPETGQITELRCSYDPNTLGKTPTDRKVKGTIQWVSAAHAVPATLRFYDRLFTMERPDLAEGEFTQYLNPHSLDLAEGFVEPWAATREPGTRFQFERIGFFIRDTKDGRDVHPVFNRIVGLRDSWAKQSEPKSESQPAKTKATPKAPAPAKPAVKRDPLADKSPEMAAAFKRLKETHAELGDNDLDVLTTDAARVAFFDAALAELDDAKLIAKWMNNEMARELKENGWGALKATGPQLAQLLILRNKGTISATIAKDVLADMLVSGTDPQKIVAAKGLEQVSDSGALEAVIDDVMTANQAEVDRFRNGEKKLMGFFVGQAMKATKGKANPKMINQLIQKKLNG
ncbi:glutamine--tRNA ligase/YqeY domain fusion protein [Acanthopleuribacter pedis]|uniref:Glutamine--tRNA ligase n=1 Tax=Acanthopleuribacter pedis TaxID=442870 RepID=A0A8J7QEM4_9BACT|nr:glutamine--tRNA ligase/YqeY domain fusion protein [Acanthopleuribacter pedis]MBO1316945.1 glutamine--tRNA ligase/YqeY domain fusion protein [Acanthopleuribacter pedis]